MRRLALGLAAALSLPLAGAPPAAAKPATEDTAAELLQRHRPILRYASAESYFAQPVRRPYGAPRRVADDVVHGRVVRDGGAVWLQYWLFFAENPQDRGVLRTGRHQGDWEFFQIELSSDRRPERATLSQHSWAEGCDWDELDRPAGGPVPAIYVANASHALYSRAGVGDRPFPDPNDEADGAGREVRPALRPVRRASPAWVRYEGRWGKSRAGLVPGEQSSPLGPPFQSSGAWDHPAAFHAERARPCGSGSPGRWWALPLLAITVLGGLMIGLCVRWVRKGRARPASE